jgi:hypothetical protein
MKVKAKRPGAGRRSERRPVQYTVRDVPPTVDAALRRRARREGKSLNRLLRDALVREAGLGGADEVVHHDLDRLAGLWEPDPAFDAAITAQDAVDEDLWR